MRAALYANLKFIPVHPPRRKQYICDMAQASVTEKATYYCLCVLLQLLIIVVPVGLL